MLRQTALTFICLALKNTVATDFDGRIAAALAKYSQRGFVLYDRLDVEGYTKDDPRSLDDGRSFSMAFAAGTTVSQHRYTVSWVLSRKANRQELRRYPSTTGLVGWVQADGRRYYQRAPNPGFVCVDPSD
jgi:hypothetical protein